MKKNKDQQAAAHTHTHICCTHLASFGFHSSNTDIQEKSAVNVLFGNT